jgi:hypothetical protein
MKTCKPFFPLLLSLLIGTTNLAYGQPSSSCTSSQSLVPEPPDLIVNGELTCYSDVALIPSITNLRYWGWPFGNIKYYPYYIYCMDFDTITTLADTSGISQQIADNHIKKNHLYNLRLTYRILENDDTIAMCPFVSINNDPNSPLSSPAQLIYNKHHYFSTEEIQVDTNICSSQFYHFISIGNGGTWDTGHMIPTCNFYSIHLSEYLNANAGPDRIICANEQTTLGGDSIDSTAAGGTPFHSNPKYNISWTGDHFTSNEPNPIVTHTTPGTYVYYLTIEDSLGNRAYDNVQIVVESCHCEFPYVITGDTVFKPIEIANDEIENLFFLAESYSKKVITPFCDYKEWLFTENGEKLFVFSSDKNGKLKGIAAVHADEPNRSVKPCIIASNSIAFISFSSIGEVIFSDNSTFGSNSNYKSITTFSINSDGSYNWKINISSDDGDVSNCDLTQNEYYLFLIGTAPTGTHIGGNFYMDNNGTFIAIYSKQTGEFIYAIEIFNRYTTSSIKYFYNTLDERRYILINTSGTITVYCLDTTLHNDYSIYNINTGVKDKMVMGLNYFYIHVSNSIICVKIECTSKATEEERSRSTDGVSIEYYWTYISSGNILDVESHGDTAFFSYYYNSPSETHIAYLDSVGQIQDDQFYTGDSTFFTLYNPYFKGYLIKSTFGHHSLTIDGFRIPLAALECNELIIEAGINRTIFYGDTTILGGSPVAQGGSGTYSYNWHSFPSGFTSTNSNPAVSPIIDTKYYLEVTDSITNICKYDSIKVEVLDTVGNYGWPQVIFANYDILHKDITIDDSGNVYILAHFKDSVFFQNSSYLSGDYHSNLLITKFSPNGTLLWKSVLVNIVSGISYSEYNHTPKIISDPVSSFILFETNLTPYYKFEENWYESSNSEWGDGHDVGVLKISNSGEFQWMIGFMEHITPSDFCVSDSMLYITGYVGGDPWAEKHFNKLVKIVDSSSIFVIKVRQSDGEVMHLHEEVTLCNCWIEPSILFDNKDNILVNIDGTIHYFDKDLQLLKTQNLYSGNSCYMDKFHYDNVKFYYILTDSSEIIRCSISMDTLTVSSVMEFQFNEVPIYDIFPMKDSTLFVSHKNYSTAPVQQDSCTIDLYNISEQKVWTGNSFNTPFITVSNDGNYLYALTKPTTDSAQFIRIDRYSIVRGGITPPLHSFFDGLVDDTMSTLFDLSGLNNRETSLSNSIDHITVYPNPTDDQIFISGIDNSSLSVEIRDIYNHVIIQSFDNTINVRSIAKGTYFVIIKDKSNLVLFKKLIIKI